MTDILLVADAPWVVTDARVAFGDASYDLDLQDDPRLTVEVWREKRHQVVIIDLQVGSMGGMAVVSAVRDAAAIDGEPAPVTVLLLDRDVDTFLAGRSGADAWMRKPFGALDLRKIVADLLETQDAARDGAG